MNKPIPAITRFKEKFPGLYTLGDEVKDIETFWESELLNERERIVDGLILDLAVIAVNTPPEKVVSEIAKKLKVLKEGGE